MAVFTETFFLGKFDLVQVFNRDEIAILRRCGLRRLCAVLDPLIEQLPGALVSERARRVIFASAFTRGPNIEGAQWFMNRVWPDVVRYVPGAVLVLAGNGSDEVLGAHRLKESSRQAMLPISRRSIQVALSP